MGGNQGYIQAPMPVSANGLQQGEMAQIPVANGMVQNMINQGASPYQIAQAQHPIMNPLFQGMMAFGQGMTGQPFYTNYQNNALRSQELSQNKIAQDFENYLREKQLGIEESKVRVESAAQRANLKNAATNYISDMTSGRFKTQEEALADFEADKDLLWEDYRDMFGNDKKKFESYFTKNIQSGWAKKVQKQEKARETAQNVTEGVRGYYNTVNIPAAVAASARTGLSAMTGGRVQIPQQAVDIARFIGNPLELYNVPYALKYWKEKFNKKK